MFFLILSTEQNKFYRNAAKQETQETAWLTNLIDNDTIILLFSGNDFA